MPLIQSKSQAAAAAILARVQNLAGHYNAAAEHLNAIVRDLLTLSDDDLAAFCNQLGPVGLNDLTSLHLAQGTAINELSEDVSSMLNESGFDVSASIVDVRPLQQKLSDQGRELVLIDGSFVVQPIQGQEG